MKETWSVVSTIDEPMPLVLAFVAHHLRCGAEGVHIFLDRPSGDADTLKSILDAHPQVHCTITDTAYWKNYVGRRPHHIPKRQRVNATNAYRETASKWLLHCDSDEYLANDPATFEALASAPSDAVFMRLPVWERVHLPEEKRESIFSDTFRSPAQRIGDKSIEDVYGVFAAMLDENVAGHTQGKSFFRTGYDLVVGLHTPNEAGVTGYVGNTLSTSRLLHFDGLTELAFLRKLKRRVDDGHGPERTSDPSRAAQLQYYIDCQNDNNGLSFLYNGLKALTHQQALALDAAGLLTSEDLDILSCVKAYFPEVNVDLTTLEFDMNLGS